MDDIGPTQGPLVTSTGLHREMGRHRGSLCSTSRFRMREGSEESDSAVPVEGSSDTRKPCEHFGARARESGRHRPWSREGRAEGTHTTAESCGHRRRCDELHARGGRASMRREHFRPRSFLRHHRSTVRSKRWPSSSDRSHRHQESAGETPKERGAGLSGLSTPTHRPDVRVGTASAARWRVGRRASGSVAIGASRDRPERREPRSLLHGAMAESDTRRVRG